KENAILLAERLRLNISSLPEDEIGYPETLTLSIGLIKVFELSDNAINNVISKLDTALYAAKHNGRNQTKIASTD
ncbi:MAG: GGDEF domain-containing protein, partial [Oleiphilaceae bacterium]